MYSVKEVAEMSGVSVRTLHYYDSIGLLCPAKNDLGYRQYSRQDIDRLQLILSHKELDSKLAEIQTILNRDVPILQLLETQLSSLQQKKDKLLTIIQTLERTIQDQKGEITMKNEEKFQGFRWEGSDPYKEEAIDKYGEEVISSSYKRMKSHEEEMVQEMNRIFQTLANQCQKKIPVEDEHSQTIINDLYQTINRYSFDCSLEVFKSIGLGYVSDPRFTENIDQFDPGTAKYACEAIGCYVNNKN